MKSPKVRRIGIVVGDDEIRAAQEVDGRLVTAKVTVTDDLKRCMRKLLTSSPFVGRTVAVGIEGRSVLVESLVIPARTSSTPAQICAERLRGDPVFDEQDAALGVATSVASGTGGESMVILAAVRRERIAAVMDACRDLGMSVHAVESAALASWRAWDGQGNQLRLVRTGLQDIVLAGTDGRLAFCRVVDGRLSPSELRATISRAGALFAGSFGELVVDGPVEDDLQVVARGLGLTVSKAPKQSGDATSLGLSRDGDILTEFTPPEERSKRVKRTVRKARFGLITAGSALVVLAGLFGWRQVMALEIDKSRLETDQRLEEQARIDLAALQSQHAERQLVARRVDDARPGHLTSRLFAVLVNAAPGHLLIEAIDITDLAVAAPASTSKRRGRTKPKEEEAPAGPTARKLVVRLGGLAADNTEVADFATNLLDSQAFTDVRVETSERILLADGTDGEHFRIYAEAETR